MALHFIGFKDDRFWNAVRVYGYPDFIHRVWDVRAKFGGERADHDVLIFAVGDETYEPSPFSWNDSERQ